MCLTATAAADDEFRLNYDVRMSIYIKLAEYAFDEKKPSKLLCTRHNYKRKEIRTRFILFLKKKLF